MDIGHLTGRKMTVKGGRNTEEKRFKEIKYDNDPSG